VRHWGWVGSRELAGDLGVAESLCDEAEDLAFAVGQLGEGGRRLGWVAACGEFGDQAAGVWPGARRYMIVLSCVQMSYARAHDHQEHGHDQEVEGHGHSHGLVDRSITSSRDGLRVVGVSLAVLLVTALVQVVIFVSTGSVALLADLIHNAGDALTAVPLGIAFFLRSFVAEKRAGYFVVFTIFVSACVAGVEAVLRLFNPQDLDHLGMLAIAGLVGFVGNEIAAQVRLRGGKRLSSPALIADGHHARVDGFVSLAVVASAAVVALGFQLGDPIIGLVITVVILRITWQSMQTIKADPSEPMA
jgi:Co/Zn/Cd efflux system component